MCLCVQLTRFSSRIAALWLMATAPLSSPVDYLIEFLQQCTYFPNNSSHKNQSSLFTHIFKRSQINKLQSFDLLVDSVQRLFGMF